MKVVCVGDSITFAQYLERDKAWTTLLAEHTGDEVINKGVCGDTTRLALERFPRDVQAHEPEMVVIQFGANDANRWLSDRGAPRVSLLAYEANLYEMVDRARRFGAETVVLCTVTRSTRSAELSADSALYSSAVRKVARETGAVLFDAELAIPDGHLLDLVHLNEEGNRIYADGLVGALSC
jgi:lysophospholipase L1-like esterase